MPDTANNVERVVIQQTDITTLLDMTVTVNASAINGGSAQTYALVVTADSNGYIGSSIQSFSLVLKLNQVISVPLPNLSR